MDISSAANEDSSSLSSHTSETAKVVPLDRPRPTPSTISFDRHELGKILNIYGRMVATGAWRDYAIDHLSDRAVFFHFPPRQRGAAFRIEKNPKLQQKQGPIQLSPQAALS